MVGYFGDEDSLIMFQNEQFQAKAGFADHPLIEVSWKSILLFKRAYYFKTTERLIAPSPVKYSNHTRQDIS